MSSIFITGAKGFVGSALLPVLQKLGHEVETDMRYLRMHKWDTIIHLAARTNIGLEFDPRIYYDNIILTEQILTLPSRIIYASSCSARHNTNPYAASKIWAEHLGEKHGNAVGLRFFNIYGPGASRGIVKFLMDTENEKTIIVRGPEIIRDYIHVDDVANEIIKFLQPSGMYIDLKTIRQYATDNNITDLNTIIADKDINLPGIEIPQLKGVFDVGTTIGTSTMDLVNLYQKLSGKSFNIYVEEAGDHEPLRMISNRIIPHMSLEEGLKRVINHGE